MWTLIESFALKRNVKYASKSFLVDFPVHETAQRWSDYRLSRSVMLYIRNHTSLWRATCMYAHGFRTRDYMKGLLSDMDIMTYDGEHICAKVQYINIRGQSCTNCTTHFYQDASSRHPYVDSCVGGKIMDCSWSACLGSIKATIDGYTSWDDNFGFYMINHTSHRCTLSSSSTTQWWLGTPV